MSINAFEISEIYSPPVPTILVPENITLGPKELLGTAEQVNNYAHALLILAEGHAYNFGRREKQELLFKPFSAPQSEALPQGSYFEFSGEVTFKGLFSTTFLIDIPTEEDQKPRELYFDYSSDHLFLRTRNEGRPTLSVREGREFAATLVRRHNKTRGNTWWVGDHEQTPEGIKQAVDVMADVIRSLYLGLNVYPGAQQSVGFSPEFLAELSIYP